MRRLVAVGAAVELVLLALVSAGCGGTKQGAGSVEIRTVRCPTTLAVEGEGPKSTPKTMTATLTSAAAKRLVFYVGALTVLGPAGWNCSSSMGADGGASITVYPAGSSADSPSAGVSVTDIPTCQGCMADLACPFFSNAQRQLGYSSSCPGTVPEGEKVTRVNRNVVSFVDPPGIKGNGLASGGSDPARGLVAFLPSQRTGSGDEAASILCTLPRSDQELCTAILDNYLDVLKRRSGSRFTAAWPTATSTTTTSAAAAPGSTQPGFLAHASNGVLFIQWTRTGDSVRGTISESYTEQSNAAQVMNESHSFTGVISGSSVTLTLDSGDNWNGTLTGSGVTLSYTSSDGTLQTFAFQRATVADYNAAVADVAAQGHAAARAQAEQQATQQAQQALDGDARALTADIATLDTHIRQLKADLGRVPPDLAKMRADLAIQKRHLDRLLAAPASRCQNGGDYQVSSADTYQVTSADNYQITSSDAYAIDGDQQSISDAIASLRSDVQKQARDQAALPAYVAVGLPTESEIQSALENASAASRAAEATWNGYLQTVKQLDSMSNDYASQADRACSQ